MDQDKTIGLLGEKMNLKWDRPWEVLESPKYNKFMHGHMTDGKPVRRVRLYKEFLSRHRVPRGESGRHLQALVLFAKLEVLRKVGGFPFAGTYGEAIAAEIAISKKVEAAGHRLALVGPHQFYYVGHRQWKAIGHRARRIPD